MVQAREVVANVISKKCPEGNDAPVPVDGRILVRKGLADLVLAEKSSEAILKDDVREARGIL